MPRQTNIGSAVINFRGNSTSLERATRRGNTSLRAHRAAIKRTQRQYVTFNTTVRNSLTAFRGLGAALGAGLLGGGIVAGITSLANLGASLRETSLAVGGTVESLQNLRFIGESDGVGTDQLDRSLMRLNQTLGEARDGSASAAEAFERLGLDAEQLSQLPLEERFLAISSSIRELGDITLQSAAAREIFGRAGLDLLPVLLQEEDALRATIARSEELGNVTNDNAAALKDLSQRFSDVGKAFTAAFANQAAGPSSGLNDALGSAAENAEQLIGVLGRVSALLGTVFLIRGGPAVVRGLIGQFRDMRTSVLDLNKAFRAGDITRYQRNIGRLGVALRGAGIIGLAALIAFEVFQILDALGLIDKAYNALASATRAFVNAMKLAFNDLVGGVEVGVNAVIDGINATSRGLSSFGSDVQDAFGDVENFTVSTFQSVFGTAREEVEKTGDVIAQAADDIVQVENAYADTEQNIANLNLAQPLEQIPAVAEEAGLSFEQLSQRAEENLRRSTDATLRASDASAQAIADGQAQLAEFQSLIGQVDLGLPFEEAQAAANAANQEFVHSAEAIRQIHNNFNELSGSANRAANAIAGVGESSARARRQFVPVGEFDALTEAFGAFSLPGVPLPPERSGAQVREDARVLAEIAEEEAERTRQRFASRSSRMVDTTPFPPRQSRAEILFDRDRPNETERFFARQTNQIENQNRRIQQQIRLQGLSGRALARQRAEDEFYNTVRRRRIELERQINTGTFTQVEQARIQLQQLDQYVNNQGPAFIAQRTREYEANVQLEGTYDRLRDAQTDQARTAEDTATQMANLFEGIASGSLDAEQSLKQLGRTLVDDLFNQLIGQ